MYKKTINLFLIPTALLLSFIAVGQIKYNSPYSSLGLGDQQAQSFGYNRGMADLGISLENPYFVNTQNPALLANIKYTSFEFAFKSIGHNVHSETASESSSDFTLDYMTIGLPISKRWKVAIGLQPLTDVNYNYQSTTQFSDSVSSSGIYKGSGGLGKLYFSNGVRILDKDIDRDSARQIYSLDVGIEGAFLFGSITKQLISQLSFDGENSNSISSYNTKNTYNDLIFKSGIAFKKGINKTERIVTYKDSVKTVKYKPYFSGAYWRFGMTYNFENNINVKRLEEIETQNASGRPVDRDTLFQDKTSTYWPQTIGFGISLDKSDVDVRKPSGERSPRIWSLGADVYFTNWQEYDPASPSVSSINTYKIILGGSYAADFYQINRMNSSYLNRILYKGGVSFEKMPYLVSGTNIYQYAATFGMSLPIGQVDDNALSSKARFVNLAFTYGIRGKADGALLQDRFYQLSISFTMNHEWFYRPKYGL